MQYVWSSVYLNACSYACCSLTEDSTRCLNWVLVPLISETRCKARHAPLSCPPNSTGLICSQSRGLYWGVSRAIVQRRFWNAMTRWHRVGISGTLFEVRAPKANKSGPPNSIGASLECRYTPVYTHRFVCLMPWNRIIILFGNTAVHFSVFVCSFFQIYLSIYLSSAPFSPKCILYMPKYTKNQSWNVKSPLKISYCKINYCKNQYKTN